MAVCWASDPVLDFQSSYAGSIPVVRSNIVRSCNMARRVYHIPLVKLREFIKSNRSEVNKIIDDKSYLEYAKLFGKSYYLVELESFLNNFKINREKKASLKVINHFNSPKFFNLLEKDLELKKVKEIDFKEYFYILTYLLANYDKKLLELFLQKIFLHYHFGVNSGSGIEINYKDIVLFLLKQQGKSVKESFGETKEGAYFKLFIDNEILFNGGGKSIKVLRKRAYREVLDILLDR